MNVYRWVHLDNTGNRKDGPLQVVAISFEKAKELLTGRIRGMTFSEGDTTSLEYFGAAKNGSKESITDINLYWD